VVAFYLPGGLPVYSFSLLIGVGAALGMGWITWRVSEKERMQSIQAGLWSLFGALVGARMVYVLVNWDYYRQHMLEAFQIYQGGLAWPGALAGGLLMAVIYAIRLRKSPGELLWSLLPLLTSLFVFAWLACWWNGCAYGAQVNGNIGLLALDDVGNRSIRFPTQVIGALATLLWFIVLDTQRAHFPSTRFSGWIGLLGLAIILFGLTYMRADPGVYLYGLRLDAWAASGFTVLALIGVLVSRR